MGWFLEDRPGHEGYIVVLVEREPGSGLLRELAYPEDKDLELRGDAARTQIKFVQIACDCGWRSPRLAPPPNVEWRPCSVELHDETANEGAARIWRDHVLRDTDWRALPRERAATEFERVRAEVDAEARTSRERR